METIWYDQYAGGEINNGVLFEYDLAKDTLSKRKDFDGINGSYPIGSLMQASNGKLYGMTIEGGSNGVGVLFEYDFATNILTKKVDFEGNSTGSYTPGNLIQANNGKLYGMTLGGGTNDDGVIFEYDPATNIFTKKIDFDGNNGRNLKEA